MKSFKEHNLIEQVSKGIQYHIERHLPLSECIFRVGSESYYEFYNLARKLVKEGRISVTPYDIEILATDIGKFAMYEGQHVPLDSPMMESELNEVYTMELIRIKGMDVLKVKDSKQRSHVEVRGKPNYEINFDKNDKLHQTIDKLDNATVAKLMAGDVVQLNPNNPRTKPSIKVAQKVMKESLMESEYEGKDVELNKPKVGGPKKYYVYVKDPSTGNIKKVSWGDTTGLKVKLNDPEARKSFAARHDCANKKDKTKPGYWACNLPRYAKSLGLSGGGNFFW